MVVGSLVTPQVSKPPEVAAPPASAVRAALQGGTVSKSQAKRNRKKLREQGA